MRVDIFRSFSRDRQRDPADYSADVNAPALPAKTGIMRLIREKLLGVAESPLINSQIVPSRGGTLDAQTWQFEPGKSNGPARSATLPNRRHTAHVSFGQETATSTSSSQSASKLSILKSPAKSAATTPSGPAVGAAGRIEVIREEVELEVATNSRSSTTTTTTSTMHRSVESNQSPVKQSTPGSHEPSSSENSQLPSSHSITLKSDRIDFPIYSEPVLVSATFGSKLRADYYDSQGSHPKFHHFAHDDDPGVMSEADTTATGFRRGGKSRASLPIVRTPSKTLEKPLGLVFLQFREETKRAVLPNEITTLDTVKALFVRAFPKVLTMEYLDRVDQRRIYILDQRKDMFYELEDLRDIRDRSVLKILEADQLQPMAPKPMSSQLVDEINYFSEPEFDNLVDSLRHTGSHSAKVPRHTMTSSSSPYSLIRPGSMSHSYPSPQYSAPPVPPKPQRSVYGCYTPLYEEPLYANTSDHKRPPSRSGTATPIVDEEARHRVDAMERHLANLTGLVQKALTGNTPVGSVPNSRRPSDSNRSHADYANVYISPKRPVVQQKDKPITCNGSAKFTNNNHRAFTNQSQPTENGIFLRYPDPMLMEYLENVQHKIRDMLGDTRALRRHHQSQALNMREIIKQNFERLKSQFNVVVAVPVGGSGSERRREASPRTRATNEIQAFQQEATRLSRDVINLETAVDGIKAGAVKQESPVRLRDVERYTTELNDLSNSLSDLRLKFPNLQENMKAVMTADMEVIIRDEMFIKEEPAKLDDMARRCKKLTGTLLNLNKLASVQDYQPVEREVSVDAPPATTPPIPQPPARRESLVQTETSPPKKEPKRIDKKAQNMLDDLLSELEVFTDMSSRETTPDHDSTIKRSPRSHAKTRTRMEELSVQEITTSLSPPSITPSNSSQSTNTTMSSMTDNSSIFSGSDSGTTISKVQVGVGDLKTIVSPVPMSGRSSGFSTPARKSSDAGRNLSDWLSSVSAPPPPLRSTSKSPVISPLSKTGGFFTLPHYGRTVSEPGDFEGGSYTEYANVRELRSPLKDQRLTPSQQDKIGSYYTSKLRKASDPGTSMGRSAMDDLANDIMANDARHGSRVNAAFLSRLDQRDPPALPPKPGQEDSQVPPPLPPRNRQEILEERHQELLRKQKQLQEQYARLQQLQRDQKVRPSSPVSKASTSPQSGSMTDLKRHQQSKLNGMDIYATPTSNKPLFHQMNITNGTMDAKTIYETDIL